MYSLKIIRKHLAFYVVEIIITSLLFYSLATLSLNVQVKVNGLSFFTLGVLAYFFGLRHAVDADHLAAIDNSTRKLIQEGKDSTFAGLFFSLGHSTVVILLSIILMVATRYTIKSLPELENVGSVAGTLISGGFLFLIGSMNLLVFIELYNEGWKKGNNIEQLLLKRGFMARYFKGLLRIVNSQYYLYPIGFLFGLGFDTASETALLAISAASAGVFSNIPIYSLMIFPFLFTTGMTLIDTTDGFFMNSAYRWAFTSTLKKLWYNLTMTIISVFVAYLVGGLELLGLIQSEFGLTGYFWDLIAEINGDVWWGNIGVLIISTFGITWGISYIIYRLKIEKNGKTEYSG